MALAVTHTFQSAKADPSDATLVKPSNWNAAHTLAMDSGFLLGRMTVGVGSVEELALTAFMQTALASPDLPTLLTNLGLGAFSTGDVKLTVKVAADSGWVMMNDQTIGDATSNATVHDNATQALFTLLYNNCADADVPIFTSAAAATTRGAQGNAAAAWAAHCQLRLPASMGRALAVAGAGSGLTSRALGSRTGEEAHTLIRGEIPAHTHRVNGQTGNDTPDHTHAIPLQHAAALGGNSVAPMGNAPTDNSETSGGASVRHTHPMDFETDAGGNSSSAAPGSGAHNNMQPTTFFNVMIKL